MNTNRKKMAFVKSFVENKKKKILISLLRMTVKILD